MLASKTTNTIPASSVLPIPAVKGHLLLPKKPTPFPNPLYDILQKGQGVVWPKVDLVVVGGAITGVTERDKVEVVKTSQATNLKLLQQQVH